MGFSEPPWINSTAFCTLVSKGESAASSACGAADGDLPTNHTKEAETTRAAAMLSKSLEREGVIGKEFVPDYS